MTKHIDICLYLLTIKTGHDLVKYSRDHIREYVPQGKGVTRVLENYLLFFSIEKYFIELSFNMTYPSKLII